MEESVEEDREHFRDLRVAADVDALEVLGEGAPEVHREGIQRVCVHRRVGELDARQKRTDAAGERVEEVAGGGAAVLVVGEEQLLEVGTDELLEGFGEVLHADDGERVCGEVEQLQVDEESSLHHGAEGEDVTVGDLRVVEGQLAEGQRVDGALVHRPERMHQVLEALRLERTVAEDESL